MNTTDTPSKTAVATDLIHQRITNMVLRHPFFSTIVLNLAVGPAPVGTACTDGTKLLYDPEFIVGLGKEQVSGLLAHEVMHVALMHPFRCTKDMDHKLANVAMDYEINGYLDSYNKEWAQRHGGDAPFPLPAGGLIDHKWDNMAFEQIYAELERQQKQNPQPNGSGNGQGKGGEGGGQGKGQGNGNDPGNFGRVERPGQADPQDQDGNGQGQGQGPTPSGGKSPTKDRMDWEAIVAKAEQIAKMQGSLPGAFAAKLDKFRRPEIPWTEYLRRYFDAHAQEDFDSRRSDRRFLPDDLYLPTLNSETMGEIVLCVDTSGSIYADHVLFERFMGEISDVVARLRPTKATLLQCDTRITDVREYRAGDNVEIDIPIKGGGGTAFEPFFDHVREHNIQPKVLVLYTDGHGSYPSAPPDYDVLFVDYGGYQNYPFGEVIRTKPLRQ